MPRAYVYACYLKKTGDVVFEGTVQEMADWFGIKRSSMRKKIDRVQDGGRYGFYNCNGGGDFERQWDELRLKFGRNLGLVWDGDTGKWLRPSQE